MTIWLDGGYERRFRELNGCLPASGVKFHGGSLRSSRRSCFAISYLRKRSERLESAAPLM